MSRENKIWLTTFTLWGLCAVPLYWLWNWHFPNDLLDTIWGFVLYIVAFGFFVLILPIKVFVERHVFPGPPV